MINDLEKSGYTNIELKRENQVLAEGKERFQNKKNELIKENTKLKDEFNKLKPIVDKFTLSLKKL